ncbi:hypothetical protein [Cellulosimicrobium sp. NPDC057127]|uniref:hypothetical protein n=1 Tax=Cellulosimicrobium sp. NPDC057127 TaxID=3346026 RepID=UPI00362DAB0C
MARTSRARPVGAVAGALAVALSACGVSGEPRDGSSGETWMIGVGHGEGDWMSCVEDSGLPVAESLSTTDIPPSSVGVRFEVEVTRSEASVVVRCIEDRLTSGSVSLERSAPLVRSGPA